MCFSAVLLMMLGTLYELPAIQNATPDSTIEYNISLRQSSDRTALRVTMSFRTGPTRQTRIDLPRCRFGTPEIWKSISDITAKNAVIKIPEEEPWVRVLNHSPNANIEFSYSVSRDPSLDTDLAYRPDVSSSHFHFFGSQWRAKLLGRPGKQTFRLEFADVPSGWAVFSNLGNGSGPYIVEANGDDLSGFIAGGKFQHSAFNVKGTPVSVYVLDSMDDPKRIVKATREVIEHQAEIFGGFKGEFFLVSVIPRAGIRAGTAIDNAFICLADANTDPLNLDVLLAHEVFHKWLPHTGTIDCWKNGSRVDEFRFDWFVEGFTEYVARRVLLDSERITIHEFVDRFNQDLKEQATNPMRRASLSVVKAALKKRMFSNRHERTSYFRGPLIALKWEHRLARSGKHTLIELVNEFVLTAAASEGEVDEDEFFDLFEKYGIDARADYLRHIVYGDPVELPTDVFEDLGFYSSAKTYQRIEHGFNVLSTRSVGVVDGVQLDGPAYNAGLRDGMTVVDLRLARKVGEVNRVVVRKRIGQLTKEELIEFKAPVVNVDTGWYRFEERD